MRARMRREGRDADLPTFALDPFRRRAHVRRRVRLRMLAALLATILVLAACSGGQGLPEGHSLRAYTLGGAVGFTDARVGGRYGVAFPILKNKSDVPIVIEKVQFVHVPDGIKVIKYRALREEGPAALYNSYEGTGSRYDYLRYRNVFRSGRAKIPPHSTGDIFFAADLRWVKFTHAIISGCQIIYKRPDGSLAQQTFECFYRMTAG